LIGSILVRKRHEERCIIGAVLTIAIKGKTTTSRSSCQVLPEWRYRFYEYPDKSRRLGNYLLSI